MEDPRYQRHPYQYPFAMPEDRTQVTGEPERHGPDPRFPDVDWIGHENQGGGYVPPDYEWTSNPKERQERESAG